MAIYNPILGSSSGRMNWDDAILHITSSTGTSIRATNGIITRTLKEHIITEDISEFIFRIGSSDYGLWTLYVTYGGVTSTVTQAVTSNIEYKIYTGSFVFKYSGNLQINGVVAQPNTKYQVDGTFNIKFLTSGTLEIISKDPEVVYDAFILGGGGAGSDGEHNSSSSNDSWGGAGGSGGYKITQTSLELNSATYAITVGGANGASSAFGSTTSAVSYVTSRTASAGGTTGGSGGTYGEYPGAGVDGAYAFSDSTLDGIKYGASGAGGPHWESTFGTNRRYGGSDGGGNGGWYSNYSPIEIQYPTGGRTNYGAGGGGGIRWRGDNSGNGSWSGAWTGGGSGGSGIVILRPHTV